MADNMPETPASAAPAIPAPQSTERLTVPASALDLGFDTNKEVNREVTRLRESAATTDKTTSDKPLEKPVVTPPVVPEKPAAPAAPAAPVTPEKPADSPAAPATPPAPALKVKIGDKEYTTEELEKLIKDKNAPATPVPAPVVPAAKPEATAPVPPTEAEVQAAETKWQTDFAAANKVDFAPTAEQLETILSGGKEAVDALGTILTNVSTKAVLLARKSIYDELNPVMQQFQQTFAPMLQNHQQITRLSTEQQFMQRHADFVPHMDQVKATADALIARYPNECKAMTTEQFLDEVAAQTDAILSHDYAKWNKAGGTWRDASRATAAPPVVPAVAATPAPAKPAIQPPAANSPAATGAGSVVPNFAKTTAASLRD